MTAVLRTWKGNYSQNIGILLLLCLAAALLAASGDEPAPTADAPSRGSESAPEGENLQLGDAYSGAGYENSLAAGLGFH